MLQLLTYGGWLHWFLCFVWVDFGLGVLCLLLLCCRGRFGLMWVFAIGLLLFKRDG